MSRTPLSRAFRRLLALALRDGPPRRPVPDPDRPASGWNRRRFLRSAAVGAGLGAFGNLPRRALAWPAPRIAIVGAGMAGLSAAYRLAEDHGLAAEVYEARSRLGGRMLSATGVLAPDLTTDLGGAFINTDHTDLRDLARRFGLRLVPVKAIATALPYPFDAYVFGNLKRSEEQIAADLGPLAQRMAEDADRLDTGYALFAPLYDRWSVAEYLKRHANLVSEPYILNLIAAVIRSEYGVETTESSALELLFTLPAVVDGEVDLLSASDEAFMVAGGSGRIIDALGAYLGDRVHTGWPLEGIEQTAVGYRLTFSEGRVVAADHVILALPFPVLRELALEVALPETLRRFIDEARLGRNEKVQAGFSDRVWYRDAGFTSNLWNDGDYSAAWDASARQPARPDGALTFFLGGRQVEAASGIRAPEIGARFVTGLDTLLPGAAAAATGRYLRTNWASSPYTRGAYSSYAPGQLTAFGGWLYVDSDLPGARQDVIVGNLAFAGEHLSDAFYGYMNGAAETGRLAARALAERISI